MTTKIFKIDKDIPYNNLKDLTYAVEVINNGGLVAFGTETVYGLGANALDKHAVKKIYTAKGRPSDNPLIVHIAELKDLYYICQNISNDALKLAKTFWGGPLTIVLEKKKIIPYETSGGLETIGVRMPSSKIAREFIRISKVPIAAPSANKSGKPSPTNAQHVYKDLNGKIDVILDSGECDVGIESTVVDMTDNPTILRPGSITKIMLEEVLNLKVFSNFNENDKNEVPKSPGVKYRHYAPNGNLTLVIGNSANVVSKIKALLKDSKIESDKIGILATKETAHLYNKNKYCVLIIGNRNNFQEISKNLFNTLRKFDDLNITEIFAEGFLEEENSVAIMNRLKKASSYKIINV